MAAGVLPIMMNDEGSPPARPTHAPGERRARYQIHQGADRRSRFLGFDDAHSQRMVYILDAKRSNGEARGLTAETRGKLARLRLNKIIWREDA